MLTKAMNSYNKNSEHLITTCPVCGFSFKPALLISKKALKCPMCGFKFKPTDLNQNIINNKPDKLI